MIKTLKVLLIAILVVGTAYPLTVGAETSTTTVTFTPGTGSVTPVDPEAPENPRVIDPVATTAIDKNNPAIDNSGNTSGLTIDTVPSFPFTVKYGTFETVYTTYETPYVQVSDRSGTAEGWSLTLTTGELTRVGSTSLPYTLTLHNGAINQAYLPDGATPTTAPTTPAGSISAISHASTPAAVTVLEAGVNAGMGTWIKKFYGTAATEKASIKIDTRNMSSTTHEPYTAQLTWTLAVTPEGDS